MSASQFSARCCCVLCTAGSTPPASCTAAPCTMQQADANFQYAGGTLVIATWCQREEPPAFTARERAALQFLYDEWAHPFFVSVQEYGRLLEVRRSYLPRHMCI